MANALPIALLAGGALLLASGKKKRRRKKAAPAYEWQEVPPTKPPAAAAKTSGPSGKAASSAVWKSRQTALAFVAGMKICNSHPGTVDGVYGPATLNAIIAFQVCAGIGVDGKWGPATDAAMKKMLVDIARGQVKVSKPPVPSGEKPKPRISIKDDIVITTAGHKYNLNAFSVPNLYFCDKDGNCFGPAGIEKNTGVMGSSIPEQFDAWGGQERFVTFWIGRENYSDIVPVTEIARDLALANPDLFFIVVRNAFRADNSINLQDDVNDAPGRGVIHSEKFGSMHSMNLTDSSEYKKRVEQTMWLLLAGLRSKAGW